MSNPHSGSISLPDFTGKTKILFSEWPGKTGLLLDQGKAKPKRFKGPHQALEWCIKHHASFYFLPPEPEELVRKN